MTTAKERYYELKKQTDKYFEGVRDPIHDYVIELEQELTKLKESQTQKSIIKLCNRVDKAEAENREMREALILIKHKLKTDPAITDTIWIDDNPMCSETAVDRINDLLGIDE